MKLFITLMLLAAMTSFSAVSNAQEPTAPSENTMNFRFDPIPLLIGAVFLHLDIKVSEQWTVGPAIKFWKYDDDFDDTSNDEYEVSFLGVGARANWFKNGVYNDGLYLGPSVSYFNVKATSENSLAGTTDEDENNGVMIGALVGYGWFWQSFNQMLGIGAVTVVGKYKTTITNSSGQEEDVDTNRGTGLAFEYTLGWTF